MFDFRKFRVLFSYMLDTCRYVCAERHGLMIRGVHPPLRPWCIYPPCFRFPPYFRKIFGLWGKFLYFHPPKFLMTFFLVIDHKFRISPIFSLFQYIFPLFRKNFYFPLLWQIFPLCFTQIHLLFAYFTCISFPPYFYHDAFMHHPMHVLDAPANDRIL